MVWMEKCRKRKQIYFRTLTTDGVWKVRFWGLAQLGDIITMESNLVFWEHLFQQSLVCMQMRDSYMSIIYRPFEQMRHYSDCCDWALFWFLNSAVLNYFATKQVWRSTILISDLVQLSISQNKN